MISIERHHNRGRGEMIEDEGKLTYTKDKEEE